MELTLHIPIPPGIPDAQAAAREQALAKVRAEWGELCVAFARALRDGVAGPALHGLTVVSNLAGTQPEVLLNYHAEADHGRT